MYQNTAISTENTGLEFQLVNMQNRDSISLQCSNKQISKHEILNY
jgi:hypothetical protein